MCSEKARLLGPANSNMGKFFSNAVTAAVQGVRGAEILGVEWINRPFFIFCHP
jgi:hypothetical protein